MIQVKNLRKSFQSGSVIQEVLKGIDINIQDGEFVSIIGPSGSGKSTFLYQLSLLDNPTEGKIFIDNLDTSNLSPEERTKFRLNNFGFVFQDYALMPELNAVENVALPILMKGDGKTKSEKQAEYVLSLVGLGHRLDHLPGQLSGGEEQRVSIARAIGGDPKILFADEPTANLDSANSRSILKIFLELNKKGQTIIMVTHEEEYAFLADRVIFLIDGIIKDIKKGKNKK